MREKIELTDNLVEAVYKLTEGNPGATRVCAELMMNTEDYDVDAPHGFLKLMSLETLEIYGSRIWMLYKDVCKENIMFVVVLLRAWQLGILSKNVINNAIDNYGNGIDLAVIVEKVRKQLPNFKAEEVK